MAANLPLDRVAVLRGAESFCFTNGVDAFSIAALARQVDTPVRAITAHYSDEAALIDAVLWRHQSTYEPEWEKVLATLASARVALELLVRTMTMMTARADGGAAYVSMLAQMTVSTRFPLTGRTVTTTPTALKLMGILTGETKVPLELLPLRLERFSFVLFGSVAAWYRHGAARVPEHEFIDDLVNTLEHVALGR
jgi:AcrR family transcriptional regulator